MKVFQPSLTKIMWINGVRDLIKKLLILQIEGRVRWLESVEFMINQGTKNFIEIGPGKVLSGLVKRINKNINIVSINSEDDIKKIDLNV